MRNTDQFRRTESILGADSTTRLSECRVAVFGAGGVGGYVIEALARSGVGTIDMIDSDKVDITNLNRQIIATHDTIGRFKVDVFEERICSICPEITVNKHIGFYLPKSSLPIEKVADTDYEKPDVGEQRAKPLPENILTEDDIDFEKFDYIVDAIDTVAAKIDIICKADSLGVPVISAMGCGNRVDPSLIKVTDIFKTQGDPLAKIMRKQLRQKRIKKLKVVCSDEEPLKPNLPGLEDIRENAGKNPPGSSPFVPAAAGLMIAGTVVRDMLNM